MGVLGNIMTKLRGADAKDAASLVVDASTDAAQLAIGREEVANAYAILHKYRQGKTNLDNKVIDNYEWYKMRHWNQVKQGEGDPNAINPVSGWLFNSIANKHADMMDNFPSANILPREEGDKAEAKMLSSIIPVILDTNGFKKVYSQSSYSKINAGTRIYGVFWDSSKLNGLGDISVKEIDILNVFWEPGVSDIQDSANFFHVEMVDNNVLRAQYPQLRDSLGGDLSLTGKYIYDDTVDTTEKSAVVAWYYKLRNESGKTVLHYVKFVNDVVLFASQDDPRYAKEGWYHHGKYPFVFDAMFPLKDTPAGFGYVDVGRSAQEFIDRGNKAVLENMLVNARPRYFFRDDGMVNEDEFLDLNQTVIHVSGDLSDAVVRPVSSSPLNDIYITMLSNKIEELKETTGNRDVSTGGTAAGVTSAAGIAAMQEASGKLARDNNANSYDAFSDVVYLIIENIRQFYDTTRSFRIMGESGAMEFVQYNNAHLRPQVSKKLFSTQETVRVPEFDIEVVPQKQSPYSKMAQNELMLSFYNAGFFNPQMADQALACLDGMDFDRKEFVVQKISQNGGMFQQMLALQQQVLSLAQIVDAEKGTKLTQELAAQMQGGAPSPMMGGISTEESKSPEVTSQEAPTAKKARQRTAESTSPR
jgi:hypothetical protein